MLSGALPFQAAHASRCPRYAMVQQRGVRVLCEANGFSVSATDLLVGMIDTLGRLVMTTLLKALAVSEAATLGATLASMLVSLLMVGILFFRPKGLFPARG
jgi:branched-subunit amino acid ABC-type transport system permease component